ncbi:MAG: DUF4349 domain-containing protein, partial [Treponema sp.]|nr:DUF4349 domain-containing protein [Treponema sp.]
RETSRSSNESDNRMVTYTVSIGLTVKNVEDTKGKLIEQVSVFDGYITRESNNSITMRIPTENMDNFIEAAKKYGKVENESKTGVDISEQYRDNVIRLENLKEVRDRYLTLLQRANTVTEILSIERELERVNTEIDVLEGRIRFAEMSVAYSNITIRLFERVTPGPLGWIFYGLYRGIKWLFVWD